jgi:hypothetical protein
MTDFERLIGAAEKGSVDEVRAVLHDHAEFHQAKRFDWCDGSS